MSPFRPQLFQNVFTTIQANRELNLSDWLDKFVSPLQNFLSLATDRPNTIEDIKLIIKSNNDNNDGASEIQVGVFFFEPIFYDPNNKKSILKHDMLFMLDDIEDFNKIINTWFIMQSELRPALNLFFWLLVQPRKIY